MTVLGTEAWITSAMEDKNVSKAIVLAGSLKRVCTGKKLVVVTTFSVSQDLREKLKDVFDLVVLIEQDEPNGLSLEECAKAEAFSLQIFNKCVYLSPGTLVLRNCDDIFEKYDKFAVLQNAEVGMDFSIYLFTPSLGYSRALEEIKRYGGGMTNKIGTNYFGLWIQNQFPNVEKLDEQYNTLLNLKSGKSRSLSSQASIVNFRDVHPLDLTLEMKERVKPQSLGTFEKFAVELFREIYNEDVKSAPNIPSNVSLQLSTVFKNEPIAIVGMSFRLPGGNNVDEFWDMLINGKEGITSLPKSRWLKKHTPQLCQQRKVDAGFLSVPVDEFDAKFFGFGEKEAELLDPQIRLLHEVTWEALEDAMIDPRSLNGTQTGVFVGSWLQDYAGMISKNSDVDVAQLHRGCSLAAGASTLSHFLKTTGPSVGTESGCSSTIVAVDMACKSLRNHESNMALACGVNLLLYPFDYDTLNFVISPDGRCKTFDEGANGFARAEGCAVLLLKRLSDAARDGDNIWGLIRGSAVTQEGVSKSLGTPTVHCESLAMELALKDANVDPSEVSYIEAHGTGTPVGDPMEITAITKAYSKGRSDPLVIGSVKTNVGHTESVSGITGIIKVLLSMKNEIIPKHLNLEKLNPAINLEAIPAKIPLEPIAWPKTPGRPRIAGVSSFGISGTDGHAIIQESPAISFPQIYEADVRPLHIMKISAKSPEAFHELLATYENMLDSKQNKFDFADLAYSANIGRATFNHRAVIIARDCKDAKTALINKSFKRAEVKTNEGQLCFLFLGEGAQYTNMGATLYATSPIFRNEFDKCDQLLKQRYGIKLSQVVWGHSGDHSHTQTSIFCIEYCLFKLWKSWGATPDYVLGYGLGEYVAAVAAGVLDLEDALMLVVERSRLIDKSPKTFAADSAANHASSQLEVVRKAYREVVRNVKRPRVEQEATKFISGIEGKVVNLHLINSEYWIRHLEQPVNYDNSHKTARAYGCSIFLEIGGRPEITSLDGLNITRESVTCLPSITEMEEEWATLLDSLSTLYLSNWKGQVNWKGFDRYFKRSRVTLPFYPFQKKPIWYELEATSSTVHPLLGRFLLTASNAASIFENKLSLKNTNFALDHIIGNTVVFPGAGFLEMCLAGGHASIHATDTSEELNKPQSPIILKSLKIASPLALYDSVVCRLQTTAKRVLTEENDQNETAYSIGVHRYVPSAHGGIGEWICHATAEFLPESVIIGEQPSPPIKVDIPAIQNTWEKTDNTEFYEKLPEVGLRFGPKFRSLETGWKSEKGMLVSVKVPLEEHEKYLVHPIIGDAMIQATMLWTSKNRPILKLQVPVQIGKFTWIQSTTSKIRYIYCTTNEQGKIDCTLLDEAGIHLAHMTDVDFIETSVKLVEGMLRQQGAAMPKLWRDMWKSAPRALQNALDFRMIKDFPFFQQTEQQAQALAAINDVGEYERSFHKNLVDLSGLYFLNAFLEMGWNPTQGKTFSVDELVAILPNPKPHFTKYIRFFLRSIVETGMLKAVPEDDSKFYFSDHPPTQIDITKGLLRVVGPEDSSRVEYQIVVRAGQHLSQVLLGKIEALQLLFPEDPSMLNASLIYEAVRPWLFPVVKILNLEMVLDPMILAATRMYTSTCTSSVPVLRLLEVGAGTGVITKHFLEHLEKTGNRYEYHFTDISASFFNSAETKLDAYVKHLVFKKFNMEEDPLVQGFCPRYFDTIMACEVLHVAKDIRHTLRNLKCLLKPGGSLQIVETTQPDPQITLSFGLLEGYWQFEDLDFRPYHTTLTPEKWEQALREVNFDEVVCKPGYNNFHSAIAARLSLSEYDNKTPLEIFEKPRHSWLIFYVESNASVAELLKEQLVGVNRKVHIVNRPVIYTESGMKEVMKSEFQFASEDVDNVEGVIYLWGLENGVINRDQTQSSLPMINLVQEMMECKVPPRLYVVTQGTAHVEGSEVTNPTAGTLHGIVKSLSNELTTVHLCYLDLSPNDSAVNQVGEIFCDLWNTEKGNRSIAFRDKNRFCTRLISAKINYNEPLLLPSGCSRFQLILPKTKLISDLEFGFLEHYQLKENEIEVQAKAMALNFRDLFTVIKPTSEFDDLNAIGLDFAGVVTKVGSKVKNRKVGDKVIGMNNDKNLALPSHLKLEENDMVLMPNNITYAEGVTLPAVFATAFHCLINVAKMKRGDTVLIHTASGGVGLCAIQLAQKIGAEIFATAGSKRKQNYLRSLGIKRIFHSRTTHFGKQILEATNERGLDIVLNSLTGEGFKEASLSALARNGRFIEMSKLNVWTLEDVKNRRPDAIYEVVDLSAMKHLELRELIAQLEEFLHGGSILPIAYERFDAVNVRGALNHLQKAKHIGKIVCIMPEIKVENSKFAATTPLFNEVSTYLVTGGLGGIGFEVVKWMLSSGAKHIAIASRSSPKPEIALQIEAWNKRGNHVEAFQVDIGDYDQCQQLFRELKSSNRGFPQLRGVMHVAGVLADAIMENQTWDKFKHTYNPKVNGTWNLHDLTKELLLEHFVVFSSVAASIGAPGQANHAASNNFEDSLAAYRRSIGLPATTINWGHWGEVGVATEIDFPGFRPITTSQGMLTLETLLKTQNTHLSIINVDSFTMAGKIFPILKTYLDDKRLLGDVKANVIVNSDEFWKAVDSAEDREGKLSEFKTFIKSTLRNILKMDQDEVIDDLAEFQSLGIDSLMMLEMKNGLQNILGSRVALTANHLKDCSNTEILANRLVDILEGEEYLSDTNLPTMEELRELVREDSILPDHIHPSEGLSMNCDVLGIKTVLLTGATGVLGPYLLKELSHRPNINKIYCLLRRKEKISPLERLLKRLQVIGIAEQVDMSKVECMHGDLTNDKFGLSEEEYNRLAMEVDAIVNSAVRSDHTAKYYKAPESKKLDIRTVNVKGTIRLLEFAVTTTLKHVYHASTLLTVTTTDEHGCLSEDWQDVESFDQVPVNAGYPFSKHIGEQLCRKAAERGIPIKTFRHPVIGGDSKSGRCDYLTNHVVLRWLAYMKLGCMPDMAAPMVVMPVDQCAQISLEVFFNSRAPTDVYNVSHANGGMDQTLIGIAEELGIHVEPVSFSQFVEKLKKEDDNSPLAHFKKAYEDEEAVLLHNFQGTPALDALKKYVEDSSRFFVNRKLPSLIHNYEGLESTEVVMRRDIRFLKESGVFEKFGIN